MNKIYRYFKIILIISLVFSILIIFLSSSLNLWQNREIIKNKIISTIVNPDDETRYVVNPLDKSLSQLPPDDINNLNISNDADIKGQWSAPFDWNVISIHSVLLPNYNVMTFGSYAIIDKEKKDPRENKKIKISDGNTYQRDAGNHQWMHHEVFSGIDFDIWNPKQGFADEAHKLFKEPVAMDSFCSIVKIIDKDTVFILGGNVNKQTTQPDTQNGTMIYNLKNQTFTRSKNLNYKRWYGSAVRTGDDKLIIMGGTDIVTDDESVIPEMLDLNDKNSEWTLLEKAKSEIFFGNTISVAERNEWSYPNSDEWSYPRAYLASDGNIVGISYDKIWVMDHKDEYRINQTGEIPLEKHGLPGILEYNNLNVNSEKYNKKLKLLIIGSAVGSTNSTVMIEKDKVLIFGGKQVGDAYAPSNKVFEIDFSDSKKPKISELKSMSYARSNGNATILPNGEVFLNGGHAFNDLEFSNFTPEIYNPINETSRTLTDSYFKRNYHSSSLLLPDGTILTAGGDVWNAEIYYPPYLFTKDWNGKTILAKRPEIIEIINENSNNRGKIILDSSSSEDISKVSLISTGNVTHAQYSELKFRSLDFVKVNNKKLSISIPSNKNEIQTGTYMLFIINEAGVPSEGKIIFIK